MQNHASVYCIGEVFPKDKDQDKLLAFDDAASVFHIGQSYEDMKARPLKCHKCGSTEFHVGQGHFYTAIRCPKCKWESCIHDG